MSGYTILIIEDNPFNIELVTAVLEAAGHDVIQAATAELGISIARSKQPDLILMDIGLPVMDGLEATRILKGGAGTRSIPIIALTAHAMKGDEELAHAAGCDGYLAKPVNTRELPDIISRFLTSNEKGEG